MKQKEPLSPQTPSQGGPRAADGRRIEISPQFLKAMREMKEGTRPLFITGRAGTGKSTLLKYFAAQFAAEGERPVVLAPTGVAALNAGGQTIHRFFRFKIDVTPEAALRKKFTAEERRLYSALKTVIIDEASMLRADLLDCIDSLLRRAGPRRKAPFGGVRMIFFGDLYQIPPVVTRDEREIFQNLYESPYFFHAKALQNMRMEIIELDKIYRQKDRGFIEILNRIRNNSVSQEDLRELNKRHRPHFQAPEEEFWITLTGTNHRADEVNRRRLSALPGRACLSRARVTGDFGRESRPAPEELFFKKRAQIMMLNNDSYGRYVNGSVGVIEDIVSMDEGEELLIVRIQDQKELVEVTRHKWESARFGLEGGKIVSRTAGKFSQLPFRLAWAVTTHKSQGKTYSRLIFDVDRIFGFGQTYVALSRCSSLEGLVLRRLLTAKDIRADFRIRKFLTNHQYSEAEKRLSREDKMRLIQSAVIAGENLRMVYLKADDMRTERTVTPVSAGREEYAGRSFEGLRAFCALRKEERMFRLDRILDLSRIPLTGPPPSIRPEGEN